MEGLPKEGLGEGHGQIFVRVPPVNPNSNFPENCRKIPYYPHTNVRGMTHMQSASATFATAGETKPAASPSHFRETVSLQSLVAPVSEEEFLARYFERKPLILHRQNPGYYGDLFTLEDFDNSVTRGRGYVKTAEATAKKQAKHHGSGASALESVLTDMRDGHTLILDGQQDFDPKLGPLCRALAQQTGARFQTNIYLTPPNGKGFQPHWDNHDVFVMQVLGSKHWKVEKTRRTLPEKDATIETEGREFRGDVHSFTLQQGDMVYLPRGYVHAAECGAENSLHITLGMYPSTWDDLLLATIKAAIQGDDSLRLFLPYGHMKGDGAGIVKQVGEILHRVADPAFLTQVFDRFRDESITKMPLDISGQIAAFFQGKDFALDDVISPRPGLCYTIRKRAEGVTLNVGTRSITFPDFFGEALEFALTASSYAIRDLPGDLEDEERLVFIERLIQEGLVVRK
jgi:ribosomal protein L16 Arg81 hydroxylase